MALTSPPPAPQRGDRATFSSRMDAFVRWLVNLPAELNAFISSITSLAAGGANSFTYTFDAVTADADPGTGKIRLGSTTQNGSVVMRVDAAPAGGGDVAAFMTGLAAGTSNVKGSVRLQKVNNPGAWLLFDITSVATLTGYYNLTVTPRGSSSANPFVAPDTLMVFFDKQGDRGTSGGTPTSQEIRDAVGTLPVVNGGTGATTAAQARDNLGAKPSGVEPINTGGTGANNAAQALINLGAVSRNTDTTMAGWLNFNNNVGLRSFDTSGVLRPLLQLDSSNNVLLVNAGGGSIRFSNSAGSTIASISEAGNFAAATLAATSDESLKENWRDLPEDFLERFAAIERAGLFNWIQSGEEDGGIGAQSIQKIAPWAVRRVSGKLHVNHSGLNTAVLHALTRRVLEKEKNA